jgi:hypothetical protein
MRLAVAAERPPPVANDNAGETGKPCAICGRPATIRFRPFCSSRCADVDLGRWLGGRYAVPTSETPGDDTSPAAEEDR